MPFEFKVKLNKMKYSLWFVVPKQLADYLDLEAGDTLSIAVSDHTMVVRKALPASEIAAEASEKSKQLVAPNETNANESNELFRSKFK